MMRLAVILISLGIFCVSSIYGQDSILKNRTIKLELSYLEGNPGGLPGDGTIFAISPDYTYTDKNGNEQYLPKSMDEIYHGVGVTITYPLRRWLVSEAGLEYFYVKGTYKTPDFTERYHTFNIPIGVRLRFLRFFYVNVGGQIDFNTNTENLHLIQASPIEYGFYTGFGMQYESKWGISIFPNYRALFFIKGTRIVNGGYRAGIGYRFKI